MTTRRLGFGAAAVLIAATACAKASEPTRVAAAPLAAGERAYQKCYACHSLEGPDPSLQGPSLAGIFGRAVAAEADYRYSPAMRAYAARQPSWTPEALGAFIADPQGTVPGNEMGFFGIRDADERRALIEFLGRT